MARTREELLAAYADVLIRIGVNLQPGQNLVILAEIPHRAFVHRLVETAYRVGARYVDVIWGDTPLAKLRYEHSEPDHLDYYPAFEVARRRQYLDENWARLSLAGEESPDVLSGVDPGRVQRARHASRRMLSFFIDATMADDISWCVAAVPTPGWAHKVFPGLTTEAAMEALWSVIFRLVRVDQPDPAAAWREHDLRLSRIAGLLEDNAVRAVHFLDTAKAEDGLPSTDLMVGLTDRPHWLSVSSVTPKGVSFFANMPTEEIYSSPHRERVEGYVRTSKPAFIMGRVLDGAYFRFVRGEAVEFRARQGQDALDEFMQLPGARRLGEVALVDVGSPVNQSGLLFYDALFDENAVCHIAFGKAYPGGMHGAAKLNAEQLAAAGLNDSSAHEDWMIGTDTMQVEGVCANGTRIDIMRDGRFVF